jgi:hypothetical protein
MSYVSLVSNYGRCYCRTLFVYVEYSITLSHFARIHLASRTARGLVGWFIFPCLQPISGPVYSLQQTVFGMRWRSLEGNMLFLLLLLLIRNVYLAYVCPLLSSLR